MVSRDVTLQVEGIKITGQLYLPDNAARIPYSTVGICHGIPAQVSVPGDRGYPLLAQRICRHGFAVFIFNFRGTGASGGNFDILGWTRDLKAVIDYLWNLPEVDKSRLALLGFSGGAAVSVYVAAQDKRVSAVATCACPAEFAFFTETEKTPLLIDQFRRVGIIRDSTFPPDIKKWRDGFRQVSPINYITGIAPRPLLLVHGGQDDVVAVNHARRLYARAGEPRRLVIVDGAGHRLRFSDPAMAAVIDWLKSGG